MELEIKKAKPNGASAKLSVVQKPCDKMTEAIVMDGGKRGQVVKVCADPACRVHHPNTPSPQQVERERAEERKRNKKKNWLLRLAIGLGYDPPTGVAPLKKADLLAVAHYLIGHLSYSQVPALAKRHKAEAKKARDRAGTSGQASCHLRRGRTLQAPLEISLLDSAYQRSTASRDDVLMDAAKRYRVDTEKLQKAVAAELSAKRDKKTKAKAKPKGRKTAA